jgi:hypothetical protein
MTWLYSMDQAVTSEEQEVGERLGELINAFALPPMSTKRIK